MPDEAYREHLRARFLRLAHLGDGWRLYVRKTVHEAEQWDKANYSYGWYEGQLSMVDAEYRKQDEAKRIRA